MELVELRASWPTHNTKVIKHKKDKTFLNPAQLPSKFEYPIPNVSEINGVAYSSHPQLLRSSTYYQT